MGVITLPGDKMEEPKTGGSGNDGGVKARPQYKDTEYRADILKAIDSQKDDSGINAFIDSYIGKLKTEFKAEKLSEEDLNDNLGCIAFYIGERRGKNLCEPEDVQIWIKALKGKEGVSMPYIRDQYTKGFESGVGECILYG